MNMHVHDRKDMRSKRREELLLEISAVKSNIDTARENFNRVYNPDEVDVYVYRLRAAETQYGCLLKKLKEL